MINKKENSILFHLQNSSARKTLLFLSPIIFSQKTVFSKNLFLRLLFLPEFAPNNFIFFVFPSGFASFLFFFSFSFKRNSFCHQVARASSAGNSENIIFSSEKLQIFCFFFHLIIFSLFPFLSTRNSNANLPLSTQRYNTKQQFISSSWGLWL